MNNSAILVLAASLAAASLLAAGDGPCPGVPTEAVDAACHDASTSPTMYDLCMGILSSSPPTAEVTAYALAAGAAAADSCSSTVVAGNKMSRNGTLTGDLSDAWFNCLANYNAARDAIAGVRDQLGRCAFADLSQWYIDALAALEECTAKLLPAGGTSTPLYGMVVGDRDRAVLAFRLAWPLVPRASWT
ncbi:hypothetical protein ACP70R_003509 [Stipagrostis hirtigluma subsp. patula]